MGTGTTSRPHEQREGRRLAERRPSFRRGSRQASNQSSVRVSLSRSGYVPLLGPCTRLLVVRYVPYVTLSLQCFVGEPNVDVGDTTIKAVQVKLPGLVASEGEKRV